MKYTSMLLVTGAIAITACGPESTGTSRDLPLAPSADQSAADVAGQVYTMTNSPWGNVVLAFNRAADGTLTPAGSYTTGGLGTGAGLGSQGSLVLDGQTLIVVNARSNQLTSFHVNGDGSLAQRSVVPSGGSLPISVTISGSLVYALDAGGAGNIAGFTLSPDGSLTPIAGSTRPLGSSNAGPAEVAFDPSGKTLVVTEKNTNTISSYVVDRSGLAAGPATAPSSGTTPFGFAFTQHGTLIVSEAFGGAPSASAVSSYEQVGDGWSAVSASVPTNQTSACWIAVTNNGRFAYSANAASGSVTGYAVSPSGALTRLDASGITGNVGAGSSVTEMALSRNSRFLYVAAGGRHEIAAFGIAGDGSLQPIAGATGLPAGFNGLAAR